MTISNPGKHLYEGITKGEVLDYYRDVAEVMLPHLHDRPLTLRRFPDGIGKAGFFQQQAGEHVPDWLRTADIPRREGGGAVRHPLCQDERSLRYLANGESGRSRRHRDRRVTGASLRSPVIDFRRRHLTREPAETCSAHRPHAR